MITENNNELDIYRKQLEDVKQKITNVIHLVSESQISINTIKDNLKELENQKIFYESQIQSISDTLKLSAVSDEMITSVIEKSRDFIKEKNIPQCKNFIENFVKKVTVFHDRVEVIFKIYLPYSNSNEIAIPLTSEENIKTLQTEYRNII